MIAVALALALSTPSANHANLSQRIEKCSNTMFDENLTTEQALKVCHAVAMSAVNGVMRLVAKSVFVGDATDYDIAVLHESMSRPYADEALRSLKCIEEMQASLDSMCAALRDVIAKQDRGEIGL